MLETHSHIDQMVEQNAITRLIAGISSISKTILDDRKKIKITVVKSTGRVEIPVRHTTDDAEFYTFGGFSFPHDPLGRSNRLLQMVDACKSMGDYEKAMWSSYLSGMSPTLRRHLEFILSTEATKLADLEEQSKKEIADLQEKHFQEWAQFESDCSGRRSLNS